MVWEDVSVTNQKPMFKLFRCTLRIGMSQTRSFSYLRGVLQGFILSPLLFNLYVNDLPFVFENTLSKPIILPNGTKLNSLSYADDIKIFITIQNRITELPRHAILFLQLLDVRYKFQKDQSYDLSIYNERRKLKPRIPCR